MEEVESATPERAAVSFAPRGRPGKPTRRERVAFSNKFQDANTPVSQDGCEARRQTYEER